MAWFMPIGSPELYALLGIRGCHLEHAFGDSQALGSGVHGAAVQEAVVARRAASAPASRRP